MKKNIVIIILAVLVVMLGLYAFAQKVKGDEVKEEADSQREIAMEQKELAETNWDELRLEVLKERERADSLQHQLDICE